MPVQNQKIITIKKQKADKNNPYAIINLSSLQLAMTQLNDSELKLWLYLNKNQCEFVLELSPKAVRAWGIGSDSTYHRAVKGLIDKGYLVQVEKDKYNFNEYVKPSKPTNFEQSKLKN